jgi:hypothetical protein
MMEMRQAKNREMHITEYSDHSITGSSGFRMAIFHMKFLSGFGMVGGHFVLAIRKLDK